MNDMHKASKIVRVIVAGDSVIAPNVANAQITQAERKSKTEHMYKEDIYNSKLLDLLLLQVLMNCPVDILPGWLNAQICLL